MGRLDRRELSPVHTYIQVSRNTGTVCRVVWLYSKFLITVATVSVIDSIFFKKAVLYILLHQKYFSTTDIVLHSHFIICIPVVISRIVYISNVFYN